MPSNINSEIISSELTIKNKTWIVFSVFRPTKESNLITFFQDLTFPLNKHLSNYNNVVVIGDFNIDEKEVTKQSLEKLNTFWETFGLRSLVKGHTCYSKTHKSSIDLILNKTSSVQLKKATETGISDVHLLISTNMKMQTTRLKSKKFLYRDYKCFDEKTFLWELDSKNITGNSIYSNENSNSNLFYQFAGVINKHAPLKAKFLRGNNKPFINKHLRREIYWRSALKNKFNRKPNKPN